MSSHCILRTIFQVAGPSHLQQTSPGDLREYDLVGQRRLATLAQGSADCDDPLLQILVIGELTEMGDWFRWFGCDSDDFIS